MPVVQLMLPRFRSAPPLFMAQKLDDKSTNDTMFTPPDSTDAQASVLVHLSARAIGSLGFAVSLLAIWFGWLLPASLTASDPSEIKKPRLSTKHRRKSASFPTRGFTTPVLQRSATADLAPILVPHSEENSSRRVSFADAPSAMIGRRNTLPEPKKSNNFSATAVSTISLHPPSPPSPLSRPGTPRNGYLDDLNAQDSDSSLSKPSRLQKLKLGFNLRTHRQPSVDKQSDRDSINSIESMASENSTKRSHCVFVAARSKSRACTAGDDGEQGLVSPSRLSFVRLLSPSIPSSGSANIQSPTGVSSKAERRRSTPIPRTYPYGAPYFASPPVLLDKNTYPNHLKALPQFEDEVQFSSARASERGTEKVSYPSGRVIPKRRSASEDWTVRL